MNLLKATLGDLQPSQKKRINKPCVVRQAGELNSSLGMLSMVFYGRLNMILTEQDIPGVPLNTDIEQISAF